jgi:HSP20 family molecular chaperone IbpA
MIMLTTQLTKRPSMFDEFDSLFYGFPKLDAFQNWDTSPLYSQTSYASRVENDTLEVVISVIGHDPKNVNVELTEDKITVKAKKNTDDKTLASTLIKDIDDTFRLGKDFNGLSAKAKIENGILKITVEKKEESKPKKLSISF